MNRVRRQPPASAPRFAAWLAVAACAVAGAAVAAADQAATVERGRRLYMAVGCYQCHGTVGQGGTAGPKIAPGPMPLEALRAFLRNGVRAMPAYPESILDDAGIVDLQAYLASIPPAPRVEDLPALRGLR
jgi:ubiquinol-cytochrome c reductase cytochrome c subunit